MEEVIDDFIGGFWQNDRIKELERLAEEHGWEFNARVRLSEQATALKGFKLFQGKRGKRLAGVMQATNAQYATRIYDYIYYSDGGKKKTTVIEVVCPEIFLTPFHIKPKKGLASLFSFGSRKKSTGIEKFASTYQLESPEPEAADLQIPDSVLEIVTESKEMSLEGEGHILLYYYNRKQIPAQDLLAEHARALEIMDKLVHDREKEYV